MKGSESSILCLAPTWQDYGVIGGLLTGFAAIC
jgi:hypothetical protein